MTTETVTALEQQATGLTSSIEALQVVDAATFAQAGELVKTVALYIRRVGEVLDPIVDAAHQAHKVAVRQRDTLLKPAAQAKALLGTRMATYEQAEAQRRREAEAAAQRDRERLEREAREQAAATQRELQAAAETVRLSEAVALEAAGDAVGAERLIAAPLVVPVVSAAPVFQPRPPVAPPRVEGVSFRDEWDFRITDESKIPRDYMVVDEKKIRGVVKAMRQATRIPGVEAFPRRVSAVRAG